MRSILYLNIDPLSYRPLRYQLYPLSSIKHKPMVLMYEEKRMSVLHTLSLQAFHTTRHELFLCLMVLFLCRSSFTEQLLPIAGRGGNGTLWEGMVFSLGGVFVSFWDSCSWVTDKIVMIITCLLYSRRLLV